MLFPSSLLLSLSGWAWGYWLIIRALRMIPSVLSRSCVSTGLHARILCIEGSNSHSGRGLVPAKVQWMSYVGVLPPSATLCTTASELNFNRPLASLYLLCLFIVTRTHSVGCFHTKKRMRLAASGKHHFLSDWEFGVRFIQEAFFIAFEQFTNKI